MDITPFKEDLERELKIFDEHLDEFKNMKYEIDLEFFNKEAYKFIKGIINERHLSFDDYYSSFYNYFKENSRHLKQLYFKFNKDGSWDTQIASPVIDYVENRFGVVLTVEDVRKIEREIENDLGINIFEFGEIPLGELDRKVKELLREEPVTTII